MRDVEVRQPATGRYLKENNTTINLADLLNNILSDDEKAIVSTSYADDGVVKGQAFNLNDVITVPGSTTLYFLLDLSALGSKVAFTMPIFLEAFSEDVCVYIYEGTDYSGGTPLTPYNLNRLSSNTPSMVVTAGATGTVLGTELRHHRIAASNKNPGQRTTLPFLILNHSKKYLLVVENQTAVDTLFEYDLTIFEAS